VGGAYGELKLVDVCWPRITGARVVGLSSIWAIGVLETCGLVIGPRSESLLRWLEVIQRLFQLGGNRMTRLVVVKRMALTKPLSIKMDDVKIVTANGTSFPLNAEKRAAAMGITRTL